MPAKKGIKGRKNEQIFEQMDYNSVQNSQQQPQQQKQTPDNNNKIHSSQVQQEQEGEILDEQSSSQKIIYQNEPFQTVNKNKQNIQEYPDSSDEDNDRLEREKKKRQEFWKNKNQKNQQTENKQPLTQAELRELAFANLQKTNKRVMLMRKKNEKRMDDLQKIRMAQQPYLTTANTHFRGSSSQYSIITHDQTGKAYYHPNHSFRVGEMRLQNFIMKNIKEQSTANYLNEVVKFQNYAYQQRKKRRHHIQ